MKMGHWFLTLVVLVIGYWLGTKYPGLFGKLTSAVKA